MFLKQFLVMKIGEKNKHLDLIKLEPNRKGGA